MVCFRNKAYHILKKKWAAQKSGHSVDVIIKMAAMLVSNAIRITAYETDVFPAISSSEYLVVPAPTAPLSIRPTQCLMRMIKVNGGIAHG